MNLSTVKAGAWTTVPAGALSVLQSGTWVTVQSMWVLSGGVWTQCYKVMTPPTGLAGSDASFCVGLTPTYQVALSWTASDATKQTRVYRNSSLIDTESAGSSSFTDSGGALIGGSTYTYQVSTYDPATGFESTKSAGVNVTVVDPC